MFSNKSVNYGKLRTNLRLCINRLKLLEKKKTELALKSRKEIVDYITAGKEDRARIRVEHIVREDYMVEAMEILEMFCDLLLARFGLLEKMKEMDPGLEEAIATILWASPRLSMDIPEFKEVSKQLTAKYSKEFTQQCQVNGLENVNEKVLHKMSVSAPPKKLIEQYLVEIAKAFNITYEPDPTAFMEIPCEPTDLVDLNFPDPPSGKGGGGGGGGMAPLMPNMQAGPDSGGMYPTQGVGGFQPAGQPPQTYNPPMPQPPHSTDVPPLPGPRSAYPGPTMATGGTSIPPSLPSKPPNAGLQSLPSYDEALTMPTGGNPSAPGDGGASAGPGMSGHPKLPSVPGAGAAMGGLPNLPSVPGGMIGDTSAGGNDVDFDDLTRRFEELKRKK